MLVLALWSSLGFSSEKNLIDQIQSHIIIGHFSQALLEAKKAKEMFPDSFAVNKLLIQSFALNHEIDSSTSLLLDYVKDKPKQQSLDVIESVCWGILSSPEYSFENLQLVHLIGASATSDAKGSQILLRGLKSTNAMVRASAVKFSIRYRDDLLKEEILHLMKKERDWFVRLELIKAIGAMRIKEGKEWLKKILLHTRYTHEEKALAIQSLVSIYETISNEELLQLTSSPRFGLRELAPIILVHLNEKEKLPQIQELLFDCSPYVRIAAISAFAFLSDFTFDEALLLKLKPLLHDKHPIVSLTAAWALAPTAKEEVKKILKEKLDDTHDEIRRLASAILSRSIYYYPDLLEEALNHFDPYVSLNVAIGMHRHQIQCKNAANTIAKVLDSSDLFIMEDEYTHPFFRFYTNNRVSHLPYIPDLPKMVNGRCKIALIRHLFELGHEKATLFLKEYLANEIWGLTFESAITLIQEADYQNIPEFQQLVSDPNPKIRVQAALAKAFSLKEPSAGKILIDAYPDLDGNMRLMILEALGQIGSEEAFDFLISQLKEPFKLTKIVSASSLIQAIYQ